jgi:outer membrane autotransporter protein
MIELRKIMVQTVALDRHTTCRSCISRPVSRIAQYLALVLVLLDAVPATAQQVAADGITVTASGTINMGTTAGEAGIALKALNGGIIESSTPLSLTTGGINTAGARALTGAQVYISSGSSIHTTGINGDGIVTSGAGSLVTAIDTTLQTDLNGYGLIAGTGGAKIVFTGGSITTLVGTGVAAFTGVLELSNTSVTTGPGAVGVWLNAGGFASLTNTDVTTSGASAYGVYMAGGGNTLDMTGGSISATGASARAIIGLAGVNTVNIRGVTIASAQSSAFEANGATAVLNVTLSDTKVTAPTAMIANAGTLNLTASNSELTGRGAKAGGGTFNLTLADNSIWKLTANSTVTTLINDPSLIDFLAPTGNPALLSSYKTLTVNNYIGEGGNIGLNTRLALDGSPSDMLVIDGGSASGTSGLIIKDTGGKGAQTIGNGILVISTVNAGTTAPRAFSLAVPAVAGPYEYDLFRGAVDGTAPENWYLHSDYIPPSEPPMTPDPPVVQVPPAPHYRQEVSLTAAVVPLAILYGRTMIDTYHERIGDRTLNGTLENSADRVGPTWSRVLGDFGRHSGDPLGVYEGSEPTFNYRLLGLQVGADLYSGANGTLGGGDVGGLYAGFGSTLADVEHALPDRNIGAGETNVLAWSLGGYWTHYFSGNNAYLDAVLQGTIYDATTDSHRLLPSAHSNGFGIAGSLEGGYPIALNEGWLLEPQAQVVLQTVNFGKFNDGAADVTFSDTGSAIGRIGARLVHTFEVDRPDGTLIAVSAWGRANLLHEFAGSPVTTFSAEQGSVPFASNLRDTWVKLDLGADINLSPSARLFGLLGYETTFDGKTRAVEGKLGFKMSW